MMGRRSALPMLAALLAGALVAPGAAPAQCRLCATPTTEAPAGGSAEAVRIEVQARLDFDQLIVTHDVGAGIARVLPDGSTSTSGSIGAIGGRAMVGRVTIRGEPGRNVRIDLPSAIELHGRTGGSIRLDSLVTDLPARPRLDSQGVLQFQFGGAIHVQGSAEGDFRGDVPITVDYL